MLKLDFPEYPASFFLSLMFQITGKMKDNLDEIMKRDVALGDLEETAGGLAEGAKQFHQTSKKVDPRP